MASSVGMNQYQYREAIVRLMRFTIIAVVAMIMIIISTVFRFEQLQLESCHKLEKEENVMECLSQ